MAHTAPVLPVSPPTNDQEEGRARAHKGCGQNDGVPSAAGRSSEPVLNADEIEAHEEVQPQRDIRTPDMPTQAETAEHKDNGHAQYRDWCPDCVKGFGR